MGVSRSEPPIPPAPVDRVPRPGHRARSRAAQGAREVGTVSLAIFLYFFVRGLMNSSDALADAHARLLVDLERRLGIFHEPAAQAWMLGHDWLVWVANAVYMYGHWPVLITTMIWLIWKRPAQFPTYRTALLVSGAVGLAVFVTFPMAPPRFLPDLGFVDTVTLHTNAYRVLQPPALTNQYASMPSLHVGWNLLMGIAIFRTTDRWFWRVFAVLMPLAMYLATILTANHFFLDGIVGSVVALLGLAIAARTSGPPRHQESPIAIGHKRSRLEAA